MTRPRRRPITGETVERAIAAETAAAAYEHRAQPVWLDETHDAVLVKLTGGRVFGTACGPIPSLAGASPDQVRTSRVVMDGAFLALEELDLFIDVDGLIARLIEQSPATPRHAAARQAGRGTSAAKAAASAANGRLGGRPRKRVAG